jgi:hypothetical protein
MGQLRLTRLRKSAVSFLQGLKPIRSRSFMPGLKARPPKEKDFLRKPQSWL